MISSGCFLSPLFNRRSDEYGGSLEHHAKIVFDVYRAIRGAVGPSYPVWIKINASDLAEGGFSFDECQWVCKALSAMGIDAIEVSGGVSLSPESAPARQVKSAENEGYFFQQALCIGGQVTADVISVGGHRSPALLNAKINEGNVSAISLCRPFICEPDLVKRCQAGSAQPSRCISCNRCFAPGPLGCKAFS